MSRSNLIAGLDIGSSNIKMVVAERKTGDSELEVVFRAQEPSFGVRKGVVIDTDSVSRITQILLNKARTELGERVDSVFVNFSGSHFFFFNI